MFTEEMERERASLGLSRARYIRYLQEFYDLEHLDRVLRKIKKIIDSSEITPVQIAYLGLLRDYLGEVDIL
jgi:hypothetical protein